VLYMYVALFFVLLVVFFILNKTSNKINKHIEIKDALLNHDELIQHAKEIAKNHSVEKNKKGIDILSHRLIDNYKFITNLYLKTNDLAKTKKNLPSGSDWLLDNFYIIEDNYKNIIRNVNNKTFKELEILNKGYYKNFPRIFILAVELISHTDGRIEKDLLIDFINAYQKIHHLSMSEIWALPLCLSIALFEKIRNLCEKLNTTQNEWNKAEEIIKLDDYGKITKALSDKLENKTFTPSFIEHLVEILKKNEIYNEPVLDFIKSKLLYENISIENIINIEHQEQAQIAISFGNSINSLRLINALDWNEIFEEISVVDKILSKDKFYKLQDKETRDYYRHKIKKIASKYNVSESKVAKHLILLASQANTDKKSHVGYYLLDEGLNLLINKLTNKNNRTRNLLPTLYFLTLFTLLLALNFALSYYCFIKTKNYTLSILSFLVLLIPLSEVSISFTNWIFTHFLEPSFLPKLDFKDGIPDEYKTIIIIPTVLPNVNRVKSIFNQLEVNYCANKNKNIYFAILGDFIDSKQEFMGNEEEIIKTGLELTKELNKKYSKNEDIFYYLHRKRIYNPAQEKWMGWERKRGAIYEFVELIRGNLDTNFIILSSDITPLKNAKYIITIDADTIMPIGSAEKLIGTICHPLNKAEYDANKGIVTKGYALIQPRIGINIESANKTIFSRIFAGNGGVDPYSKAISDIYQDIFKEAIFTGKGIFDIDIFKDSLKNIPENTLLSHDLIEGSYLRVGLATDIELIDNYPEKYSSYIMRQHRWTRGDWQTIPWLKSKIKTSNGDLINNPLNYISKWKIIDNLRRSLVFISNFILTTYASIFIKDKLLISTALICMFFPVFLGFLDYLNLKYFISPKEKLNGNLIYGLKASFYQCLLNFIFLPYNTYIMAHAILKTLYRIYISKKNTLEWVTAADVESSLNNDLKSFIIRMYPGLIISSVYLLLGLFKQTLILPLIFSLIWFTSPFVAYYISKPTIRKYEFIKEDIDILRRIARKTWLFYEEFTDKSNNYLPIDNYQQSPVKKVAHRTSPTNIGFYLLSCLCAKNLGYISLSKMLTKINETLSTIEKLKKWKGHLYNWYDTKTLEVLHPYYISTVDNGNFIGYLITLKEGIKSLLNEPIFSKNDIEGLKDTLKLDNNLKEYVEQLEQLTKNESFDIKKWISILNELEKLEPSNLFRQKVVDAAKDFKQEIEKFIPLYLLNDDEFITKIHNFSIKNLNKFYEDMLKDKPEISVYLHNVKNLLNFAHKIISRIETIIDNTNFSLLYDEKRDLFSIGFNVEENKLTNSYYDLLASESRLASYIAVAKREVPVSHWFRLGRSLVKINGYRSLVSWTGTMFEYFMPPIVMKTFENTLLSETYYTAIKAQIKYGNDRKVPWGTSESGFYTFDLLLNYQYKAFGVPDLGLKRGLINDLVISPYSTILALPFSPKESIENLKRIINEIGEGIYGLYEAIDYTPERLPKNKNAAVVESFMAHHQGMILASINNFINQNILVRYFHSDPTIKCGEFLLQEKIPLRVIITKEHKEIVKPFKREVYKEQTIVREVGAFESDIPICHILSNGNYSIILTNGGSSFSKYNDIYINRWRDDAIQRRYGTFIFLRNLNDNKVLSTTYEPICKKVKYYKAKFSQDKAEYLLKEDNLEIHTEICVSPEDNCEIRKVNITNFSNDNITLEATSYSEIVLNNIMADIAHPAFSNLFVRTEFDDKYNCIIASRRPREEGRPPHFAFHSLLVIGNKLGNIEYETDRLKFLGRGKNISEPQALYQPLTKSIGAVLDPIFSLRCRLEIKSGETATLVFFTGYGKTKEEVLELSKKYSDYSNVKRAFELANIRSKMELRYLNLKASEVIDFDNMLSHILYLSPLKAKYKDIIKQNKKGQQELWKFGISGDIPIVLVTINKCEDIEAIKTMIKAHEYWRNKGLKVDLVILNQDESSYLQPLRDLIQDTIMRSITSDVLNKSGGIYVLNEKEMNEEDVILLFTVARLIIHAQKGSISKQIKLQTSYIENQKIDIEIPQEELIFKDIPVPELDYFNGYGGFDIENKEYVIKLKENSSTPLPWSNIVANKNLGFLITESGGGYTWFKNSRENKLTPWSNDPVSDPPSEVIYIRDEHTKEFWSITSNPIRKNIPYIIHHGIGYSKFIQESHNLKQELLCFVPKDDSVKINLIKITNTAYVKRKISIYYYIKPMLGVSENSTQQYIVTDLITHTGTILFKNTYNMDFPDCIAFIDSSEEKDSFTCNRMEFIGPYRNLKNPYGLLKEKLSNSFGAGLDPCVAIKLTVSLEPNEEKEISIILGAANSKEEVEKLAIKYKNLNNCKKSFEEVKSYWKSILDVIQVDTPEKSINIMLNAWLIYQTLSCRLFARSAFYQSGGAYGFRDQLQDVLSMLNIAPEIAKEQIILHSKHQFLEGDVLHWWHMCKDIKGIRTKFSDDLLWLPFVVAEYITKTGDYSILDIETHFVEGEKLKENEDEKYFTPIKSQEKASIYEHCIKAIEHSLKFGEHGIPLMGSGDWNDGMNTVGNKGKGESVWLGWFLFSILQKFIPICKFKLDYELAGKYQEISKKIIKAIEENAWDGEWYKRAYFDDGTPLGSSINPECKIDSLAQTWGIISNGANYNRALIAMKSVENYLINKEAGIIMLFTPPFDKSNLNPGYIKGYVPGVRENGGQYTHAATWVIYAYALLGDGDKAVELYNMINPINHSRTQFEVSKYKVEPYVMAADVYTVEPHVGRGGWTWYTGSSSWMYKVGLEEILGFKKNGDKLIIDPCIPKSWTQYSITYKYKSSTYKIIVKNPNSKNKGVSKIIIDNNVSENNIINLNDDGKIHQVEVIM